jgi:predicted enzyme related to lactoylglutathione lyase
MMPAEVPPFWAVYFSVADTDAAVARITELGGSVMMPPMDIEPGRFATVADPTGATFNVITLKPDLTR